MIERQLRFGKKFSIVAVAEGAMSRKEAAARQARITKPALDPAQPAAEEKDAHGYKLVRESLASRLARELQVRTRTEARVTSLGHVQRGGVPSAADRLLATLLGVKAAHLLAEGHYNVLWRPVTARRFPSPWKRWRAGRTLCPWIIPGGDGPARWAPTWGLAMPSFSAC